jgi:hypothetical protein
VSASVGVRCSWLGFLLVLAMPAFPSVLHKTPRGAESFGPVGWTGGVLVPGGATRLARAHG